MSRSACNTTLHQDTYCQLLVTNKRMQCAGHWFAITSEADAHKPTSCGAYAPEHHAATGTARSVLAG